MSSALTRNIEMIDSQSLQKWYNTLYSRTLDLVGDYAGDELFILEGDSLLLQCFSDNQIDFDEGFQLLHATYTVERFLAQLHRRSCNFHVVFFKDHAHGCIPPGIVPEVWPKYRLAREAILQHLSQNLPSVVPSMEIECFETYHCEDFAKYLVSANTYFLMCHDGAFSDSKAGRSPELAFEDLKLSSDDDDSHHSDACETAGETKSAWRTSAIFRLMIHHFICRGYNVSLINSLEFRDTKAMAMILEGSAERASRLYNASISEDLSHSSEPDSEEDTVSKIELARGNTIARNMRPQITAKVPALTIVDQTIYQRLSEEFLEAANNQPNLRMTQRESISILALSAMFKSRGIERSENILAARSILLHAVVLRECTLSERATSHKNARLDEAFLGCYIQVLFDIITSAWWQKLAADMHCDIADMVDGRLLHETQAMLQQSSHRNSFTALIRFRFEILASVLEDLCGVSLGLKPGINNSEHIGTTKTCGSKGEKTFSQGSISAAVLPFNNPILDPHLRPVSLTVDTSAGKMADLAMPRISEELSHWHNHKNSLSTKSVVNLTWWQLRRNQFFMADIRQYAASLTNSAGGILQPETVVLRSEISNQRKRIHASPLEKRNAPRGTQWRKSHSPQDIHRSRTGPVSARNQVAIHQQAKRNEATIKHLQALQVKIAALDREHDYVSRYVKVKHYLNSLSGDKKDVLEPEVMTYGLSTLIHIWKEKCSRNQRDQSMPVAALIWNVICEITKRNHGITEDIANCVQNTTKNLNFPAVNISSQDKRPLSFQFVTMNLNRVDLDIGTSPLEFQLVQAGPYLDRSMGSAPDPRVPDFEPDKWQREILDEIDARKSLFVVAPTSAGKTFISFYAIKQILEDDNEGVLVYVAPTKALVNQIAAEVQARFSKKFKHDGKSVWAIHTRDYRINNPTGCQVLITVPHILQIMLLAPVNANVWSSRVKRIIFDEIHCIGQAEDGVVWEQLLLLAPCPIIALSATVGNPQEFNKWLELTQRANGNELKMIEHSNRYSDLRKYIYHPPSSFVFNGLSDPVLLAPLGLDSSPNMSFMHPIASLIDRSRGIPKDLTLEPRDCWTLWKAMEKCRTEHFPVDRSLDPFVALPATIRRADIVEWEARLKALLKAWMNDNKSPFDAVLKELSPMPQAGPPSQFQVSSGKLKKSDTKHEIKKNSILDTTLPLICSLYDQGALPALIFNYDRNYCERICFFLLGQLELEEKRWKDSSPVWANKIAEWKTWQLLEKNHDRTQKRKEAGQTEKMSKNEQILELASTEASKYSSFDPESPVSGFHVADTRKLLPSEFEKYAEELRQRLVPVRLIDALRRGIGVHHAGLNRKYRQVCEILFRKGYLRVVVATGTLALGINMPCKTVIFSGDSVFLTALGFRQAAGRAGRRGFDFLGNVVFQGVPYTKVCRLLSSKLPSLNGHFPVTTSLVLRLLILLHESKQAPYAIKAINSILSCPRIYLGGPESKHTVLHHLRFSIEYLRRNYLLNEWGMPLNFSNTVSHLYYTGNASFAFHALLSGGYFHNLCEEIDHKPKQVLLDLMLVMSHLFGRHNLRPAILETRETAPKSSPSVIILPPMPDKAARILRSHNESTLSIYSAYVSTYIEQHVKTPDSTLPLTNLKCGGDKSPIELHPSMSFQPRTRVTSAFVALSGHRDKWNSIPELCKNVRSGVWLEQAVVPYVGLYPEEGNLPLNAYLFDFFKHGNIHALEKDNMIRKGDIWFALNDFSLVLATIVTSFENFFKLSPDADLDLLDTIGSGEAREEELDFSEARDLPKPARQQNKIHRRQLAPSNPTKAQRFEVAESWEDEVSDQEPKEVAEKKEAGKGMPAEDHTQMNAVLDAQEMSQVLKAFRMLQGEFNDKFKAMWA